MHTSRILSLSVDLPLVVVLVDDDQRIRTFLSGLADLLDDVVAVVDTVDVVVREPHR